MVADILSNKQNYDVDAVRRRVLCNRRAFIFNYFLCAKLTNLWY